MAIEQLFSRTVNSCRLPQRKKAQQSYLSTTVLQMIASWTSNDSTQMNLKQIFGRFASHLNFLYSIHFLSTRNSQSVDFSDSAIQTVLVSFARRWWWLPQMSRYFENSSNWRRWFRCLLLCWNFLDHQKESVYIVGRCPSNPESLPRLIALMNLFYLPCHTSSSQLPWFFSIPSIFPSVRILWQLPL